MRILILGGTAEARTLAGRVVEMGHEVVSSLAGRTRDPKLPEGNVRMGGFGGIAGLEAYLSAARIERIVDATHPYAGTISANAVAAARASGVPLVRLMRPEWEPGFGERWRVVESFAEAAATLPAGARVLVTSGHMELSRLLERDDCYFVVRLIGPPAEPLPGNTKLILSRPPYTVENELALMRNEATTHLVTKNSGGGQTRAKLEAARQLAVEVVMIARPAYGPALEVASVGEAMAALGLA